jgi:hypothetical protein
MTTMKNEDEYNQNKKTQFTTEYLHLDTHFPALGIESNTTKHLITSRNQFESYKHSNKSIKTQLPIIFPSHIQSLKEARSKEINFKQNLGKKVNKQRSDAFERLSNREHLAKNLFKTSLCHSIERGEDCPHGKNCRFAHSLEELKTTNCFFGDQCKFVHNSTGKWYNKGYKICKHIHPGESNENFLHRTKNEQDITDTSVSKTKNVLHVSPEFTTQAIAIALKSGQDIKIEVI